MAMRYPVRTRSTWRTRMGGVNHDDRSGTDSPGWPYARRRGGVTWTRHGSIRPRQSRGCVTA
jgi:hypothetical protein